MYYNYNDEDEDDLQFPSDELPVPPYVAIAPPRAMSASAPPFSSQFSSMYSSEVLISP